MPKALTLRKPELSAYGCKIIAVRWELLDEDGVGYRILWVEAAFDTNRPECVAFPYKRSKRGACCISWDEQAVSYNPDAALALRDVMAQLKEKHGYTYEPEDAAEPVYLLPGEVVADGDY